MFEIKTGLTNLTLLLLRYTTRRMKLQLTGAIYLFREQATIFKGILGRTCDSLGKSFSELLHRACSYHK